MRFTAVVLLAVLISPPLLAQADLEAVSLTPATATVQTGQPFDVTLRVRNNGPATAPAVVAVSGSAGFWYRGVQAPAGWQCDAQTSVHSVVCRNEAFAAATEATFSVALLAARKPSQQGPHVIDGYLYNPLSTGVDPNHLNNGKRAQITITPAPAVANLAVTASPESLRVAEGASFHLRFDVTNHGPDDAGETLFAVNAPAAMTGAGSGWTCRTASPFSMVCTRASLPAGATAPVDVHVTAPNHDALMTVMGEAFALHTRQVATDPQKFVAVAVGSAEVWERLLVPVTATNVAGQHGSLWKTDVTMLVLADMVPQIRPEYCDPTPPGCMMPGAAPLPPRVPFDAHSYGVVRDWPTGGQFIYVRKENVDEVHINARIYDQSRQQETAGSELPIVRDDEWHTGTLSLLDIPVAPQYRHTLRIYSPAASRVAIRVYGGDDEPIAALTRTLEVPAETFTVTNANLPLRPAYAQFDLAQLVPLAGLDDVRVDVEPLEGGAVWAFVSITNNDTHHVTMVSPQ